MCCECDARVPPRPDANRVQPTGLESSMPDLRPPMRPVPAKPLIAPRVRSRIGGHRGPPDLESCMSHVEGKVAVVTGGAGGFGLRNRRISRQGGVEGKSGSVRVDLGGRRYFTKKKK